MGPSRATLTFTSRTAITHCDRCLRKTGLSWRGVLD